MICRCGFDFKNKYNHPCHGKGYTCLKPSKERFYNAKLASLAGTQMKLEVSDTFACDDCWKIFTDITNNRELK